MPPPKPSSGDLSPQVSIFFSTRPGGSRKAPFGWGLHLFPNGGKRCQIGFKRGTGCLGAAQGGMPVPFFRWGGRDPPPPWDWWGRRLGTLLLRGGWGGFLFHLKKGIWPPPLLTQPSGLPSPGDPGRLGCNSNSVTQHKETHKKNFTENIWQKSSYFHRTDNSLFCFLSSLKLF